MGISEKYVRTVKMTCASTRSYTIELRRETIDEAIKKVLEKSEVLVNIEGVLIRAKFKDSIIMLTPQGRIAIIKGPKEEELKNFLEELFR
ncbi:MAG: hypothetical protein DRJ44_02130 [Thermoprotei archaeon]|nr:MAG: hypothetical protein DRZ80_05870 [Thermoprotei archaeon]RLE77404.1 MAG: hypothetical protein DRJ44_02130 [Thermoprotei archaeon]